MSNGDELCVLYAARRSRPTGSWGFISPIPSWPWEKHNHRFRRTISLSLKGGNNYVFVVVDLSDSVRWPFCTRSTRWPNSASKMYWSNAVFIKKKMLQSSIIVQRALSLICLLCMPLWSLMRAIEKADPVSLGILNMPIIVLIHICLSPGTS